MVTLADLSRSWSLVQRAEGRSPHTIKTHRDCIARLIPFTGNDPANLTRRTLTDFYAWRLENVAPATAWTDFKVHRVFIRWLVEEGELPSDPMAGMRQPKVALRPVPVLTSDDETRLLEACSGRTRRDKRDTAIIVLAIDSGLRRGELAGLGLRDVNLEAGTVVVTGKGKTRVVPISSRAVLAIDRHLRASKVRDSLFGLTPSGVSQAFKTRCRQAGLDESIHLHATRHSFAHRWLAMGGSETDLMTLAGWSPGSRSMLDRYGASARAERAIDAYRRLRA